MRRVTEKDCERILIALRQTLPVWYRRQKPEKWAGGTQPLVMYLILSAQILAPILVTLWFRKSLQSNPAATTEQVEGAYTRANLWIMGPLLISILTPKTNFELGVSFANFCLSLMAFIWIQYDYSRALEIRRPRTADGAIQTTPPVAFFVQALRGFACLFCFYILFHFLNVLAIVILFYATPVLVRMLFSTLPMAESPLRDRIHQVFLQAGVNLGQIRIIQSKHRNFSNAMVCGTRFGIGPFKRTLLITESLFSRLDEEEFVAVMRHEAAHFKLNHLRDRFLSVIGTYIAGLVLVLVPGFLVTSILLKLHWFLPDVQAALSLLCTLGALYWMNRVTFAVIHRQEHEADLEAVHLGTDPGVMISALEKITADHGGANARKKSFIRRLMLNHAHPSLEERVDVIRAGAFARTRLVQYPVWKLAAVYAMMIAFSAYLFSSSPDKAGAHRDIASETRQPANISH